MADLTQEHTLQVTKTARYYTIEPEGETKQILFVIHGYRQLAKYFIKQFEPLRQHGVKVVAPEGLHRFYIEGYSGRVGASWMTKEARLQDIDDYVAYLNLLYDSLNIDVSLSIGLLGFSQGGPTACRWLGASAIPFERLILHSTVFPNDFDFDMHQDRLKRLRTTAIFGDNDQFADEATISAKMEWMESKGINLDLLRFEGGHEIFIDHVIRSLGS